MYGVVTQLGGSPGEARWLTFTEILYAAESRGYKNLISVPVEESVGHWMYLWSRQRFMERA
jgi:hypothetical protein